MIQLCMNTAPACLLPEAARCIGAVSSITAANLHHTVLPPLIIFQKLTSYALFIDMRTAFLNDYSANDFILGVKSLYSA